MTTALSIPQAPDRVRMYRDVGTRLRAVMTDQGVDALILLMNSHVSYATGSSWPLVDAGLSHVERPVAVVLADDPDPHLFMSATAVATTGPGIPADHVHEPAYLEFDEGVEQFTATFRDLITVGSSAALDEMTGAMRRARDARRAAAVGAGRTPDRPFGLIHPAGVRLPHRHGAGARAGGLGGRHRRLPK